MAYGSKMLNVLKYLGVVALISVLGSGTAAAERYLTIADAQRLCFPRADRFDAGTVRFSSEQKKTIERKTGIPVRNSGNKFWTAWGGTNLLGVLVLDVVLGKHEMIDYVAAIAPDGKILQVEILEFRESHGGQIRGDKWRDQFKGKTAAAPFRLNEDIYNISGATISCRHVTGGIKRVLATYEMLIRPPLADKLPDDAAKP